MKKILLIDDNNSTRHFLVNIIERKGYEAITACRGKEGIELFQKHQPDCVFLDVHMPDMEGSDVFKKIKQFNKKAKIYFVTGDAYFEKLANELGADGYISKPINIESLLKIIDLTISSSTGGGHES